MSVQDEFAQIPEELRPKVVKKINKLQKYIEHSGGFNDIWLYTLSIIVFKMYEDMGLEVSMSPRGELEGIETNVNENTPRLIITDL